ncbi:toprim domain-containing protein [Rickettsiales endosymbiont of Stachyamoeba lipophora]|uniref:toprim domain-containing protein n=1 Tax=Rickettsiales endosymbiont of Stachyamoeba lipophora TaxID=2486578 RepID=UPI000F6525EB|nr:toprim domain-containing protein [Rickettsiales endosymbiont of Stachyamoeba lipophora]AZL15907.1 hypothetical protein EF513_05035 [Rickettsiales endosymbiont of Stachyamoeba lipophora]
MNIKRVLNIVPEDANCFSDILKKIEPSSIYPYYVDINKLSFYVLRRNIKGPKPGQNDKKIFPYCYVEFLTGTYTWVNKWPDFIRPLYNLPDIIHYPEKSILIVEGEKTAEAAKKAFPEWVATTSSGGSNAADKSDWSILHNRIVYISYDCDEAGIKYYNKVIEILKNIRVKEINIIQTEKLWELKNDITS